MIARAAKDKREVLNDAVRSKRRPFSETTLVKIGTNSETNLAADKLF